MTPAGVKQPLQIKVFQSSHLQSAVYDPNARTLEIQFTNGRKYTNPLDGSAPVPSGLWDAFVKSGSPGQFFDLEIKPYWNGVELKPDDRKDWKDRKQGKR